MIPYVVSVSLPPAHYATICRIADVHEVNPADAVRAIVAAYIATLERK
jgi:hypothetical protein